MVTNAIPSSGKLDFSKGHKTLTCWWKHRICEEIMYYVVMFPEDLSSGFSVKIDI